MSFTSRLCLVLAGSFALATPVLGAGVTLNSDVTVEQVSVDKAGRKTVSYVKPNIVKPGDRIKFSIAYKNDGAQPAKDFVATNPIPKAVAYERAEGPASVSVDGGRTFGALNTLRLNDRPATASDVTHVRWKFAEPIPAGAGGTLIFFGSVR